MNTLDLWQGMPEFKQEKKSAYRVVNFLVGDRKIIVRFNSSMDIARFEIRTKFV